METDGVASNEPKVGVHVHDDVDFDVDDVFDVTLDIHFAVDVDVDVKD